MRLNKRKNIIIMAAIVVAFVAAVLIVTFIVNEDTVLKNQNESDDNNKTLSYIETDLISKNRYYEIDLRCMEAKLDDDIAYSLDYYGKMPCENGGKLYKQYAVTGITTAGLIYGYPNVSLNQLGVNSKEEARQATQFAIWRLAQAEGVDDSKKTEYIFDMENLQPQEGYEESLDRIKTAAEAIIEKSLEKPYYANPTLEIVGEASKITLIDNDKMLVGPLRIDGKGYDIAKITVWLENEPESAVLCDKEGNEKTEFINNENIYIKVNQNIGDVSFSLTVEAQGMHNVGFVYGTGDEEDGKQNFVVLSELEDKLTSIIDINVPAITGNIHISVIGKDKQPISGAEITLRDVQGNLINVFETDDNGAIEMNKLVVGKYVIEQTKELDGYSIMSIPTQVCVTYDNTVNLCIGNTLIEGKLKVVSLDESKEKVLEGITYEVLDENKNIIETLVSDENGVILSKELKKGVYYFRVVNGPDNIYINSTERMFEITDANVIESYSVMHYYARGKVSFSFKDEDEKPVEGVEVQILDENDNVVDIINSDEHGEATSKNLLLGNYKYRLTKVPSGFEDDESKYDFSITYGFQILEVECECREKR